MGQTWDVLLCDIDGTLTTMTGDGELEPYPGVLEALLEVRKRLPVVYVTNTTSIPRAQLAQKLQRIGFPCDEKELFTPVVVAQAFLKASGMTSGIGFFAQRAEEEFRWFTPDPEHGKVVLVADEGLDVTFRQVQQAFRLLMNGARLFALQRNRYFRGADGLLRIDLGPLVAALEYASDQKATIFGKPSQVLFESIAARMHTKLHRMAIVGDDAEFDVMYPMALGLSGILVRTGKFRPDILSRLPVEPTHQLESFADIATLFAT